jgi:soluble lytic murein transglycosylase
MKHVLTMLLLGSILGTAVARPVTPADEVQFSAARDALRAGERTRLARAAGTLRDTPLAPWADYWLLKLRLDDGNSADVDAFLQKEAGSYLAERMRADYLKYLGKRQNWAAFRTEYPRLVQPDQEVSCYNLQARLDQQDLASLDEARPLWFSVIDLPESCMPLMERLITDKRLDADDLWQRVRRLTENKKTAAARQLFRYLPAASARDARAIDTAVEHPARYLTQLPAHFAERQVGRELALIAVARMARSDPAPAAHLWRGIERHFGDEDRAYAWGQIAWQAALRHQPEALKWFELAGDNLGTEQRAWLARAALRAQDWRRLLAAIAAMPREQADLPDWTYWRGRALAATGHQEDALASYRKLSGQPNFYGNLADEELGHALTVPPRATPPSAEELAQAAALPGLQRAMAVLRTDSRIEGVREWVWNLRGMNDRQLLAAAELARRNGFYDRAINTADRTQAEHDYALRYLAPFRSEVEARTVDLGLDSAWVFGLMRQESRFVMDARSSAGAKGLMQLMPATARWVAQKIGLEGYHPHQVTDMDVNVRLGTNYLKMVLDGLDQHPVLASAAYNAGPGRARQWRGERQLEGAIYAETIPFSETRDYVKRVMSNAVYYAALFDGRPQSLKSRLGVVRPRGFGDAVASELP